MKILLYLLSILIFVNTMIKSNNSDKTKIHVIPHSHNDAGWLWTFDEYYYGTGGSNVSVKNILDNMVLSLSENQDRTFIYVEMAFFTKWYKTQSSQTKDKVKLYLQQGRFEFINGGYVMHDEATTYYQHFIDQMRLGLLFLKSEFNYVPKIAWFIDPFGHSAANAYVLSKMGFEKIAIVRIDYKEKDVRKREKSLEFIYIPFANYDKAKIFTHVTYDHYCPPSSLSPLIKEKEFNWTQTEIENIAMQAYNEMKIWNSGYKHNNVLLMYGCDFTFTESNANYRNIEKIMEYMNNEKHSLDMVMNYSTPSKYFEEVFKSVDNWPEYKNNDFFPYAEYPYSYWTGYFTSRPYLKGMIRKTANYLVLSTHLFLEMLMKKKVNKSLIGNEKDMLQNLFELREILAICQHHDAVSGTAKEKVSENYITLMEDSTNKVTASINLMKEIRESNTPSGKIKKNILNSALKKTPQLLYLERVPFVSSESESDHKKSNTKFLIYNPGLSGNYLISFDYEDSNFQLEHNDGKKTPIESNIVCINKNSEYPLELKCKANFFFEFNSSQISYEIILQKTLEPRALQNEELHSFTIDDDEVLFAYNEKSKNKNEFMFMSKQNQSKYQFNLSHAYYDSLFSSDIRPMGTNPSGAYILSPSKENPDIFKIIPEKSFITKGNKFIQITLRFEQSHMHIKLIDNKYLEIETIWDKITKQRIGKEYILLVSSDIENNVKFPNETYRPEVWTDSNGMKMMRRYKDFREGYDYLVTEKVASNFYPVNSMISMRDRKGIIYHPDEYGVNDKNQRMITLLNDRPQSIGSMKQGEYIAILNRYSTGDDWKGLEEPLFEKNSEKYLYLKHYLVFGSEFDRQYLRNVIHNKPSFFANKNFSGPEANSILNKIVQCSSNIDVNYHILNENEFFIQFYNYGDYYYDQIEKNIEGECTFKDGDLSYKIKEYNFGGVVEIDQNYFEIEAKGNKKRIVKLSPQELKLFKIFMN